MTPDGLTGFEIAVALAAPVLSLLGAVGGVAIGAYLQARLERRRMARAKYDQALSALARQQAARWGVGIGVPPQYTKAATPKKRAR